MYDDLREIQLLSRLAAFHGAVRTAALCQSRTDRRLVRRLAQDGRLELHPNRVVAMPGADPSVILCRRIDGVMTCAHAMQFYGLPLQRPPGPLHVAVPAHRGRLPDGLGRTTVHRVDDLAVPAQEAAPVACVEHALICFMRCAGELDALIAIDAALRCGLVRKDDLRSCLSGKRNMSLRALVDRAHPGARSILETIARYELEEAGYRPFPAIIIEGLGEADLVLTSHPEDIVLGNQPGTQMLRPGARPALIVETDGYTYHCRPAQWELDRLRDQSSTACGHLTIRLTGRQVRNHSTVEIIAPIAEKFGISPG
jgi:hypothetical protein avisC_11930